MLLCDVVSLTSQLQISEIYIAHPAQCAHSRVRAAAETKASTAVLLFAVAHLQSQDCRQVQLLAFIIKDSEKRFRVDLLHTYPPSPVARRGVCEEVGLSFRRK